MRPWYDPRYLSAKVIIRGNSPADLSDVVPAKLKKNMADKSNQGTEKLRPGLTIQDAILRVGGRICTV